MFSYCLKCRKKTGSKSRRVAKTKNRKSMVLSKCALCGSKKSRFIKEQEASRLLSSLRIKIPILREFPLREYVSF